MCLIFVFEMIFLLAPDLEVLAVSGVPPSSPSGCMIYVYFFDMLLPERRLRVAPGTLAVSRAACPKRGRRANRCTGRSSTTEDPLLAQEVCGHL